jgi:putative spermidine/putrescine transport system permease protein
MPLLLRLYVVVIALFLLFPLAIVIAVSFDPGSYIIFPTSGFSAKWYVSMWSNDTIVRAMQNSLIVGFASSAMATMVAVPAALSVVRREDTGGFMYALILSPFTVPWIVYGLALLFFWGAAGLDLSIWTLILGHTVIAIPYVLRVTVAVLKTMPPSLVRAARNLGASPLRAFFHVTLPYIRGGVLAGVSFAFIVSFTNIPVSLFVTTADNITLPIAIFNYMINNFEPIVAAISVVQVALILCVLFFARRFIRLERN